MVLAQTKLLPSQPEVPEHVKNVFEDIWDVLGLLDARKSQKKLQKVLKFYTFWAELPSEILLKMYEVLAFLHISWLLRASKSSKTFPMSSKTYLAFLRTSNGLRSNSVCVGSNYFWCILRLKNRRDFYSMISTYHLEFCKNVWSFAIFANILAFAGVSEPQNVLDVFTNIFNMFRNLRLTWK